MSTTNKTAPRSSGEIIKIFGAKGCTVVVEHLGHSYRAGGEIVHRAEKAKRGLADLSTAFELLGL